VKKILMEGLFISPYDHAMIANSQPANRWACAMDESFAIISRLCSTDYAYRPSGGRLGIPK
jgi:hypothetical protein